ncbi:sulfite exporter TauE/SafE family protein [Ferrimonas lipolytica]|uniref:Probable membrane transporter protein n=1 Tax=Ferrimonas lipolytica TaxID=2724191 RepID=A0A6H1UHL3_9GAMM|nr:sulfite exporter TauE/SafE family protein [Ferrimonas lipolytica]QIZ77803.1 sulfite exporter TauE/SafE family protein [Ferrimonas lipolytica]
MSDLLIYLCLGAFAGTLSGLFGIGGGLVIVPVLITTFSLMGLSQDIYIHMAIATSLATIVITAISAIQNHHQRGNVDWSIVKRFTPGVLFGAYLGGIIADRVPADGLAILLGVFMFVIATQMLFGLKPDAGRKLPHSGGLIAAGSVIGTLSAMVGIGGASLSVPFLRYCSVDMKRAVGTSATLTLPLAVAGVTSFIVNGWNAVDLPEWTLGYVYLPAFAGIVVASSQFVRVGAALGAKLSQLWLQRAFAAFLIFMGCKLLFG